MIAYGFPKYFEKLAFQLFLNFLQFTREICYFIKKYFLTVPIVFSVYKQNFRLNNLNTRATMNDLFGCTFKVKVTYININNS